MSSSKRLPVYKRVENPPGMKLTTRDAEIIQAVWRYRFLQRDQIQKLFDLSLQMANRRLSRLFQHRYLNRFPLPEDSRQAARNVQPVYCLDTKGADLLVTKQGVARGELKWYRDRNKVSRSKVRHTLRISDFMVAMELAAKARGDRIVNWIPDWQLANLKERVEDPETSKTYPIRPDGYFIYQVASSGRRSHFFLEADRATMSNPTFARKIKAYGLYHKQGGYNEQFGTWSLRVLTATTSQRRLRNLKKTTEEAGGKSRYWFTTFEALDPEKVLSGPVWEVAGSREPRSLIK